VRTKIVPVIIGALGTIEKGSDQNRQLLAGQRSAMELQNIAVRTAFVKCWGKVIWIYHRTATLLVTDENKFKIYNNKKNDNKNKNKHYNNKLKEFSYLPYFDFECNFCKSSFCSFNPLSPEFSFKF
jgi:hypothetical protein